MLNLDENTEKDSPELIIEYQLQFHTPQPIPASSLLAVSVVRVRPNGYLRMLLGFLSSKLMTVSLWLVRVIGGERYLTIDYGDPFAASLTRNSDENSKK